MKQHEDTEVLHGVESPRQQTSGKGDFPRPGHSESPDGRSQRQQGPEQGEETEESPYSTWGGKAGQHRAGCVPGPQGTSEGVAGGGTATLL